MSKRILWLDLETTGLDPARHRILEVYAAVAPLDDPMSATEVIDLPVAYPMMDWPLLDAFIIKMHTDNGLLMDCHERGVSLIDVEKELCRRFPSESKEDQLILAGNSVHFDHGFIRQHMPLFARRLSHRHYDVSAVSLYAESLGFRIDVGEPAHRAKADIGRSMRIAQKIRGAFFGIRERPSEHVELEKAL